MRIEKYREQKKIVVLISRVTFKVTNFIPAKSHLLPHAVNLKNNAVMSVDSRPQNPRLQSIKL